MAETKSGKVMVVDDDADMRCVLTEILTMEGLEASEAKDGEEALNLLAHAPPDLILLDEQMPKMDGTRFLQRVAQHPRWKVIPVIMISATAGALLPGAVALLRKPFELDALVATVRRVLKLRVVT
ncbi:MAG: response regulator [Myxococcota bacterium]|nr:response regulator [Myxococcota bacterium]